MPVPLAAAALLAAAPLVAHANAAEPDSFDLLIDAPAGAVRVRVNVTVDRRPLAEGPQRYREALLGRLDGDGDGAISADEAASAPTPRALGGGNGGDGRDAVDDLLARFAAAEEAGRPGLPAAEFADWVAGAMGAPVRAARRRTGGDAADVLALLDADRDGLLTPSELAAGTAARDFDGDGTLSAAELAPFRDPDADRERPQFPADVPFRLDPAPPAGAVPDLEVSVQLVARSFGLPKVAVAANRAPDRLKIDAGRRGFTLAIDGGESAGGTVLEFAGDRAASVGSDAVSLGLIELVRADGDANGYLDPDEFPAAALPGAPRFADVDRDGDEQATREEVRAYLEEDVRLSGSRVYVLAEGTTGGLFAALDRDGDGRLTPAERAAASSDLAAGRFAPDRDGDGAVAAAELAGSFKLSVGPGRSAPPGADSGMMTVDAPDGPRPAEPAGPRWFARSDRNRDGAVTWPEFVGPRSAFDRFDANADGSLTPAEAENPAAPAANRAERD